MLHALVFYCLCPFLQILLKAPIRELAVLLPPPSVVVGVYCLYLDYNRAKITILGVDIEICINMLWLEFFCVHDVNAAGELLAEPSTEFEGTRGGHGGVAVEVEGNVGGISALYCA